MKNYSFKENIHSSEKCIIAQGYTWQVARQQAPAPAGREPVPVSLPPLGS